MATHTPGPWKNSLPDAEGFSHINAPEWGKLATVVVMVQDSYGEPSDLVPSPEGEANARLIAEAPALLAELKGFLINPAIQGTHAAARAEAIVAKVEGR